MTITEEKTLALQVRARELALATVETILRNDPEMFAVMKAHPAPLALGIEAGIIGLLRALAEVNS
jgi:hypothetical protein